MVETVTFKANQSAKRLCPERREEEKLNKYQIMCSLCSREDQRVGELGRGGEHFKKSIAEAGSRIENVNDKGSKNQSAIRVSSQNA